VVYVVEVKTRNYVAEIQDARETFCNYVNGEQEPHVKY
jgi:hypothetical protein